MVQVLWMKRILLHFRELMTLLDETQESIVGFFKTLQVVLEQFVSWFKDLDFSKSEGRVQAIFDVVNIENFLSDRLSINFIEQVFDIFLTNYDCCCYFVDFQSSFRHIVAFVFIWLSLLFTSFIRLPMFVLNFLIYFASNDCVDFRYDLLVYF